jgi:hypothetical protein
VCAGSEVVKKRERGKVVEPRVKREWGRAGRAKRERAEREINERVRKGRETESNEGKVRRGEV